MVTQPTVTESLAAFFAAQAASHPGADLLARWSPAMETQINVSPAGGEVVEGRRHVYTNGAYEWWNIRIPKGANTNDPAFNDYPLSWPLSQHVQAIGSTGWDWRDKVSRWVGFDFDAITGHAPGIGLSDDQLAAVQQTACAVPWVEVRRSTSGAGLHLYVMLDAVATANHTQHAALARAVLGMLTTETGFDFLQAVDACGGILWIWHRKLATSNQGLSLIKPSERTLVAADLPANWRDHTRVVTRQAAKVTTGGAEDYASRQQRVPLDEDHKRLIARCGVWVPDHHLWQTHTCDLADAHRELQLQGIFETNSPGSDRAQANCFCFPLSAGAWRVVRFTKGTREAGTWTQDGHDWTQCDFNVPASLKLLAVQAHATEAKADAYQFATPADARRAVEALGGQLDRLPTTWQDRPTTLVRLADYRIQAIVPRAAGDPNYLAGWVRAPRGWQQITTAHDPPPTAEAGQPDDLLRVLITPNGDHAGVVVRSASGTWDCHPKAFIQATLQAVAGMGSKESELAIGQATSHRWQLVTLPFQDEYPGNRQWNRHAPRFAVAPLARDQTGEHPHWDRVLDHIGASLDGRTPAGGGDYLLSWLAAMVQEPFEPLPYLFLYGPENCGKSILWEGLAQLVTGGVVKADRALSGNGEFNGELDGAVLCVVEETDLSHGREALNRLKDYVTSRTLSIRRMKTNLYHVPNTTHWMQCANHPDACPIVDGDTRITAIRVEALQRAEIPKAQLLAALRAEGPAFLRTLLDYDLPTATGRLRVPVIDTDDKARVQQMNRCPLVEFVTEVCQARPGCVGPFQEFYGAFSEWLAPDERAKWNRRNVARGLRELAVCVARHTGNTTCVANLAWSPMMQAERDQIWQVENGRLI